MSLDSFFDQLQHPNPNLRADAMLAIANQSDSQVIERLIEILDETDVTYRRAAVKTLGVIGSDAVPPIVDQLLHSENVTVRSSCAKALAQISVNHPTVQFPEEGLQGLKTAVGDPNPVVHIASVMALGTMGTVAFNILKELLDTTDNPAVAVAIVNALADLKDERSIEVLQKASADQSLDSYVQESAVSALSRLEMTMNFNRS